MSELPLQLTENLTGCEYGNRKALPRLVDMAVTADQVGCGSDPGRVHEVVVAGIVGYPAIGGKVLADPMEPGPDFFVQEILDFRLAQSELRIGQNPQVFLKIRMHYRINKRQVRK